MPFSATNARLLLDPPAPGAWNMAVDEAMLRLAAEAGRTTLRFYEWSEPTISLGYFQAWQDRANHAASSGCAIVRRTTGGGAILHDRELTYSFVTPIADRLAGEVQRLYRDFHETLIEALREMLFVSQNKHLAGELKLHESAATAPSNAEPFLCFQRRATGDCLWDGHKIAGSAQRRHYGAVLQHGSVLLMRSPRAPELPGVNDCAPASLGAGQLARAWQGRIAKRLGLELERGALDATENALATELVSSKYAHDDWTMRR